jgi:pyridoxal phosphate enzyme (YggS family)
VTETGREIREKYLFILEQIRQAAVSTGRKADEVNLVVVSKAQPLTVIEAAVEAGIRTFGENYPEEGCEKIAHFKGIEGLEWHMIGHLQSRKARLVAESFQWLHSLDSLHLAEKLNTILNEMSKTLPVLVEMNVSGEESKFGWPAWDESHWIDLLPAIEKLLQFPQLNIRGLMTMPPLGEDAGQARPYFGKLRRLRDFLERRLPGIKMPELSMGTSADFLAAVMEGATMVRVGQSILGERPARRV